MSMLKVDNLSVHYGMIQAVRDVSFEVNEGEVVSLIGANGAGKTTILRTLSGLVRPSSGKIEFLGQEIQKNAGSEKSWQVVFHKFQKDATSFLA